jgi:hypothetical protein
LHHVVYPLDDVLLGALTVAQETKTLALYGCKDYETDQGRKTKGVPHRATPCGVNQYRYLQFDRLISAQRGGQDAGVSARWREKTLSGIYDKGAVSSSGVVSPFHLTGG